MGDTMPSITTHHRQHLLGLAAAVLAVAAAPLLLGADPPEGRSLLRNGDFSEDATRAVNWVTRDSGNLATFALLPPEPGHPSRLFSAEISDASVRPWTVELRQSLGDSLRKGEVLFLSFDYRITPGYAFHCYWQKDAAPWPKFLSIRLAEPVGEWQRCAMAMRVQSDLGERESSLSLHLAEQQGKVQFRNFAMIAYPPETDLADLPTNVDPVLGGDFHDANWRSETLERIPAVRQAGLDVRVRQAGKPVPDATVTVQQSARDFVFGVQVAAPLFHPPTLAMPELTELRDQLAPVADRLDSYRAAILDSGLFNAVSLGEALTWRITESWGAAVAPPVVEQFSARGLPILGGALYCPTYRHAPPACRQMPPDTLRQNLLGFIDKQIRQYQGRIRQWDVVHGAITYPEMYDAIGENSLVDAYKTARAADPDALLLYSDDAALTTPAAERMEEMLALVTWLRGNGADIGMLGLVARLSPPYIAPQTIEQRLTRIHDAVQLPIIITALAVDAERENIQEERLRDLLVACFAHPAVVGIVFADIWDATTPNDRAGLFRQNFVAKPAGTLVRTLLAEDWWTNAAATTDADGMVSIPAFLGRHRVTVEAGGRRASREITLAKGGATIEIELEGNAP